MATAEAGQGTTPGGRVSGRQAGIDTIRAIGVLAVVCYHYAYRFHPGYVGGGAHVAVFSPGHLGVNLFFIVSAFCISGSLERSAGLARFVAKRVARLLPAYIACALFTYAVVSAFGLPGREVSAGVAALNLLWVNMVLPVSHIDGAYWTIAYELRFYLVLGLLYYALGRDYGAVTRWWRVLTVASIALHFLGVAAGRGGLPGAHVAEIVTRNLLLYPYPGYFLIGLTLFRWDVCSRGQRVLDVALFAAAVLLTGDAVAERLICLAFLPLCFVLFRVRDLPVPRAVLIVGYVSYPLYLLHQNVGLVVMRETAPYGPFAVRALLAFAIVLALAAVVTYRLEPRVRPPVERVIGDALTRLFAPIAGIARRRAAALPVADYER